MQFVPERYGTQFLAYFGSPINVPRIDGDAWIYALRAACAGCLALYISFSLNLDGSHWALTTCYIVGSERQSGPIFAKSSTAHCTVPIKESAFRTGIIQSLCLWRSGKRGINTVDSQEPLAVKSRTLAGEKP
jgi:hypothetical protein